MYDLVYNYDIFEDLNWAQMYIDKIILVELRRDAKWSRLVPVVYDAANGYFEGYLGKCYNVGMISSNKVYVNIRRGSSTMIGTPDYEDIEDALLRLRNRGVIFIDKIEVINKNEVMYEIEVVNSEVKKYENYVKVMWGGK